MKNLLIALVIILFWNSVSFADDKIVLKCKQYNDDWLAVVDLDKMTFDMNRFDKGIPYEHRFDIVDVNDKQIKAEFIQTTFTGGGYVKYLVTVTVDRYLGVIDDSGKKIEDTRVDKSGPNFYLKSFFLNNCEKVKINKKF